MTNTYLHCIDRMEPDIAAVDTGPALASIAISLKRIADALEKPQVTMNYNVDGQFHDLTNLAYEMGKSFDRGTRDHR